MEENKKNDLAFLSYLDENNNKIEGIFEIIYLDSSLIKFRTKGNILTLPTARILKLKQKEDKEYDRRL